MIFGPSLIAAIAAALVGLAALWANSGRAVNRVFFTGSLHVALWLALLHVTVSADEGLPWLRLTSAVGALTAMHLWMIKEVVADETQCMTGILMRGKWWMAVCVALAALPFSESFIPGHSVPSAPVFGWGYYGFIAGIIGVFVMLSRSTLRQMRAQTGLRRMELQMVLLGGSAAAVAIILLMGLRGLLDQPSLVQVQPFVILLFYAGTVVTMTMHRVFDARQLVLLGLQKITLLGLVAGGAYATDRVIGYFLPEPFAFIVTTGLALWFAGRTNAWLDHLLHFYPQATAARQEAFAVARRETKVENLELAFCEVLCGWGQTDRGLIVSGATGELIGGGTKLPGDGEVVKALKQLRWATPERLVRERLTPARQALAKFLREERLGALVIGEGPTLTVLVGVGVAATRRPFTYPQVTQLQELASIMESALERAHFSVKAQHAEQLATVGLLGASLAHEIRNPLVTIKTFVQLLPKHYHDPIFREKFFHLITEEVTRIDRLTEQLLDLASPRAYKSEETELHPVLRTSLELVAAKATDKQIQFLTEFHAAPDRVMTDPSAAKQVLLNLCFNAIQAVEQQPGERWVKVSTRNHPRAVEMIVEDSGPGIAPEIRPKLFQPFQSTKSSGFGLGLAICSDILSGLDASISVDSASPGRGAVFRVVFPCPA